MRTVHPISTLLTAWLLTFAAGFGAANAQEFNFSSGGGPIALVIDQAPAGSEPTDALDASTEIFWDALFGSTAKITVSTMAPDQSFKLFLSATITSRSAGSMGIEQPEVTLNDGMLAADLIRDIPATFPERQGYATLQYRASALVADGNSAMHGDDNHLVTLTIQAQ